MPTLELTGKDGNAYSFDIGEPTGRPPVSKVKRKRRNPKAPGIRPVPLPDDSLEWTGGFSDRPIEYDPPQQGHQMDMIEQAAKTSGGTLKFEIVCYSDPANKEPHNKCKVTIREFDNATPPKEVQGSPYSSADIDVLRQEELRQFFAKAYLKAKPLKN
jgi:hypothetical protein